MKFKTIVQLLAVLGLLAGTACSDNKTKKSSVAKASTDTSTKASTETNDDQSELAKITSKILELDAELKAEKKGDNDEEYITLLSNDIYQLTKQAQATLNQSIDQYAIFLHSTNRAAAQLKDVETRIFNNPSHQSLNLDSLEADLRVAERNIKEYRVEMNKSLEAVQTVQVEFQTIAALCTSCPISLGDTRRKSLETAQAAFEERIKNMRHDGHVLFDRGEKGKKKAETEIIQDNKTSVDVYDQMDLIISMQKIMNKRLLEPAQKVLDLKGDEIREEVKHLNAIKSLLD